VTSFLRRAKKQHLKQKKLWPARVLKVSAEVGSAVIVVGVMDSNGDVPVPEVMFYLNGSISDWDGFIRILRPETLTHGMMGGLKERMVKKKNRLARTRRESKSRRRKRRSN
jgi:hypothetical protein